MVRKEKRSLSPGTSSYIPGLPTKASVRAISTPGFAVPQPGGKGSILWATEAEILSHRAAGAGVLMNSYLPRALVLRYSTEDSILILELI